MSLEASGVHLERGYGFDLRVPDFKLEPGQSMRLIGPNGCGKSTLLRAIASLIVPESGRITWYSKPVQANTEYLSDLFYVGDQTGLSATLTAEENLTFKDEIAVGKKSNNPIEALTIMNAQEFSDIPIKFLSKGQKQRVGLARLFLRSKKIWLLDEPMTGLDHENRNHFSRLLDNHIATGGIAIVATHENFNANHCFFTTDLSK